MKNRNPKKTIYTVIFLLAIIPIVSFGMGDRERLETRCLMCGMDAAKSETMFVLYLKGDKKLYACCLNCADQLIERFQDDLISMTTADFDSREQVDAAMAYYIEGSKVIPKGSMFPFLPAFGTLEEAEAFQKKEGGRILTYQEAIDLCRDHRKRVHER